MIGIYCIENTLNGKKYIGQSTDINIRFINHKISLKNNNHHNQHLQNSWNKDGENAFIFSVVEECEENELDSREKYWFSIYDTLDYKKGYNIKEPERNGRHSNATKEKMSKTRTGKKFSLLTKEKMSKSATGKVFSDNHRDNISKNHCDISKENNPNFGKKLKSHSSVFYGVYFHKQLKKWVATTCINGKSRYIGIFEKEIEAAMAYDNFINENGFPNPLNFPKETEENYGNIYT